jgi:hypothetical protein
MRLTAPKMASSYIYMPIAASNYYTSLGECIPDLYINRDAKPCSPLHRALSTTTLPAYFLLPHNGGSFHVPETHQFLQTSPNQQMHQNLEETYTMETHSNVFSSKTHLKTE